MGFRVRLPTRCGARATAIAPLWNKDVFGLRVDAGINSASSCHFLLLFQCKLPDACRSRASHRFSSPIARGFLRAHSPHSWRVGRFLPLLVSTNVVLCEWQKRKRLSLGSVSIRLRFDGDS